MNVTQRYRPFAGGYVSDFDQFMDRYLATHPDVGLQRRRGWDLWWDHQVDLGEIEKQRADTVPVKPYSYE